MVDKYQDIFKDEINKTNEQLAQKLAGSTMQSSVGQILDLYDKTRANNKLKLNKLPEQERDLIIHAKK